MATIAPIVPPSSEPQQAQARLFYPTFAFVLLALVVIGFTPTFFLNDYMAKRPNPPHVLLHGIVNSAWFLFFFVQSLLIASGRFRWHRTLGAIGAGVAGCVVIVGIATALMLYPRLVALGLPKEMLAQAAGGPRFVQLARDAGSFVLFGGFVASAIYWRNRSMTHKRLMLLGSVTLSGAALPRMFAWLMPGVILPPVGMWLVFLCLLGALVLHDYKVIGRLHRATRIGGAVFLVCTFVLVTLLPILFAGPPPT